MTKNTKIIIAVTIFIIALVLFLFWDKIKSRLKKEDVIEVMPPTNNTNYGVGNGSVVNTTQTTPSITINELKKGDLIKTTQPLNVYAAYSDWKSNTAIIIKTLDKGKFVGVVHAVVNNVVQVYLPDGQKAVVYRTGITKM